MNGSRLSNYDVIIIGAGSVGTPSAFFLSQTGVRTMVIDKAPSVGQGSNKRAIGGIRATHSDAAKIRLCLRSIDVFSSWKDIYGDEIEWTKSGYCFVAYRQQEEKILKDLLVTQKSFGLNIDWYDKKDLLQIIPDFNPIDLIGGTFSPDDGNASPLLSIYSFYAHAEKYGACFRFNEKVNEITTNNGQVIGVKTDRGVYYADIVINAAGPWSREVAQLAGVNIPVEPDSHEAAVTEPVAQFLKPMIVDIRPAEGSSNFYFYQHFTGQIIFCITPSPNIRGFNTEETSTFLPMVAKRMVDIMPRLKNIRVRRTWRGLYPMTPDSSPIVGWTKEPKGLLLATGMCGQGFMLGPGLGELICRMVKNKLTAEDYEVLEFLSPYRDYTVQELLQ